MDRALLELQASRALFDARLFADALHAHEGWTMRWGSVEVHAAKVVWHDFGKVTFVATFPEVCWIDPPDEGVLLLLDGEMRGMQRVDHPGDTQFVVTWDVGLQREPVA